MSERRSNGTNIEDGASTNSAACTGSWMARTYASFVCQQHWEWQQGAWVIAEEIFFGKLKPSLSGLNPSLTRIPWLHTYQPHPLLTITTAEQQRHIRRDNALPPPHPHTCTTRRWWYQWHQEGGPRASELGHRERVQPQGAEKVLSMTRATIYMVSQVGNMTTIEGRFLHFHFLLLGPLTHFYCGSPSWGGCNPGMLADFTWSMGNRWPT